MSLIKRDRGVSDPVTTIKSCVLMIITIVPNGISFGQNASG